MDTQSSVKEYYGKVLQSSSDLKTDACCTPDAPPAFLREAIAGVHPEVASRYYGCGFVAPLGLHGASVIDLGCGAGRDAYVLSRLVGEQGRVVGVDMTPQQLAVAHAHLDWHRKQYGYANSNVSLIEGDIERLDTLALDTGAFDVAVSNCVVNLCADKEAVFQAVHGLLKVGGEFYFADVYADRRLPENVRGDPVARGECLGGALYWKDFLKLARGAGFADPRLVSARPLAVNDKGLRDRLGGARFSAATWRLFRADGVEETREDYGHCAVYNGGLAHDDGEFVFDRDCVLARDARVPICRNTFRILRASRFASYFDFPDSATAHHGAFYGGDAPSPFENGPNATVADGACCR